MQAGDTLASIAQQIWGDSSFWYLIANANGISDPGATLVAGENLIIPNKVHNDANNSGTNAVYNQSQIIGNVVPDAPKVPPPPKHHHGCGIIGEIIMVVIAIAVSVVTAGAALAAMGVAGISTIGAGITAMATGSLMGTIGGALATIAAGAIGGAVGSAVSQGVGLATGMQSKFNWGAVGEASASEIIGSDDSLNTREFE